MTLLIVFSLVWCAALWIFKDWFSTGIASSVLAVAFGALSLYCSIFGDQLRVAAITLDQRFASRLPTLLGRLSRVRCPAPDLVALVLLLLAFTSSLGWSTVVWLADRVEQGDIRFPGGLEHQLFLMLRFGGAFLLGTIVPTMVMYGVTRTFLNRSEPFLHAFSACVLGVVLANCSAALVTGRWWFVARPVTAVLGVVLVSLLLASLVLLGRYFGQVLLRRRQ